MGALVLLLDAEALGAVLAAVVTHELGHLAALTALGISVDGISLTATGPVIRCAVPRFGPEAVVASLAGPAFGAAVCVLLRSRWPLAAEMSAVLTAVNLLPVLPLDGGRALRAVLGGRRRAMRVMAILRIAVCSLLSMVGIQCAIHGLGWAPLLFAFWLFLLPKTCKTSPDDVQYSY